MNLFDLAPDSYFDAVIDIMNRLGFKLMAYITAHSDDLTYFIDIELARSTRLFFSLPGRSCIVMLELLEEFTTETSYRRVWSGSIIVAWDQFRESDSLQRHNKQGKYIDSFAISGYHIPKAFQKTEFHAQSAESASNFWLQDFQQIIVDSTNLLDPIVFRKIFARILMNIMPFMFNQFTHLSVRAFAPYHRFPNCEKWFWLLFPIDRLREKVRRQILVPLELV